MSLDQDQLENVFLSIENDYSKNRVRTTLSRQDLRAGVAAIDDWIDSNMSSFVASLPAAVRDNTTTKQKVRMFMWTISKRWEIE